MGQNAILNITDGAKVGSFDLNAYGKDTITIGRRRNNDIVVDNAKVSHQHGKFYKQNGFWFYQDLNSTNGTIVNGRKINSVGLNTNDVMIFDTVPGNDSLKIDVKIMEVADSIPPIEPPFTPPQEPPKKKGKVALIIALSVVLVAAIVVAVLLLVKKTGVNGSPENCAVNAVEGLAERDTSKMKKSFHEKMWPDVNLTIDDYLNNKYSGITMEKIKAGTPINVSSDDKKAYKAALKLGYDLDMDDAKMVRVTFMASDGSSTVEQSIDVLCVEIDSSWYVADFE